MAAWETRKNIWRSLARSVAFKFLTFDLAWIASRERERYNRLQALGPRRTNRACRLCNPSFPTTRVEHVCVHNQTTQFEYTSVWNSKCQWQRKSGSEEHTLPPERSSVPGCPTSLRPLRPPPPLPSREKPPVERFQVVSLEPTTHQFICIPRFRGCGFGCRV